MYFKRVLVKNVVKLKGGRFMTIYVNARFSVYASVKRDDIEARIQKVVRSNRILDNVTIRISKAVDGARLIRLGVDLLKNKALYKPKRGRKKEGEDKKKIEDGVRVVKEQLALMAEDIADETTSLCFDDGSCITIHGKYDYIDYSREKMEEEMDKIRESWLY